MTETVGSVNKPKKQFRLLFHCEGGSLPYLTPHLMSTYFAPKSSTVANHLTLGIEVRDSCVVAVYGRKKQAKKEKKSRSAAALDEHAKSGPPRRDNNNNDNKKDDNNNKPTGYTFQGRKLKRDLRLPDGYDTLSVPCFDLVDSTDKGGKNGKNTKFPSSTPNEVTLVTLHGHQKLSARLFVDVVEHLDARSHVGLFDQTPKATATVSGDDGETSASSRSEKRRKQACERTRAWTTLCLRASSSPKLWIPVTGGDRLDHRARSAEHAATLLPDHPQVQGVAFVGLHHVESRETRSRILKQCLSKVEGKKSLVLETTDLSQIVDAAVCGVDIIGSSLPTLWARSAKVLVLDVEGWRNAQPQPQNTEGTNERTSETEEEGRPKSCKRARIETQQERDNKAKSENGIIDLSNASYARDKSPLLTGHTRAYVHHLINAHELLAQILIFVHNLHHFLKLFEEMTVACNCGKENEFKDYIERQLK